METGGEQAPEIHPVQDPPDAKLPPLNAGGEQAPEIYPAHHPPDSVKQCVDIETPSISQVNLVTHCSRCVACILHPPPHKSLMMG